MAEQCAQSSIATPTWWPDLHASSLSSWSSNTNPWHKNPSSNSSDEEDLSTTSFTNASNHSGLSVDSSRRLVDQSANELIAETNNPTWSHVLFGEMNRSQLEVGRNSINQLSYKSSANGMFEPACDYLKKMDNSWEFTNTPSSLNSFEKHFNGFNEGFIESERLSKLSNLVNNWSIAPPITTNINHQFDPRGVNANERLKYEQPQIEASGDLFHPSFNANFAEYQLGLNNTMVADHNNKYYYGMPDMPCSSTRNFADVSFNSFLSKPSVEIHGPKPVLFRSSNVKKQGIQASSHPTISARSNGRGQGITSEGKKKRSEQNSDAAIKKPKRESSIVSSTAKMQVPKVKVADKITALQQIVSPFGKTDTASVLGEAIGHIKYLQEQVLLLCNPYMKSNVSKDPWGGFERKDRGDLMKADLKSRGLCLVPASCTTPICRDTAGSDYWTSTPSNYRGGLGYLYR